MNSSVGGCLKVPPPHHEIGKSVVEHCSSIPRVYTFGEGQKSKKYLLKNCEISQFTIEILIKNSYNFLLKFSKFFSFFVQTRRILRCFLTFPCSMEIIRQILMLFRLTTNSSRCSQNFQGFFIPFPIVLLNLSHLSRFFWINFSAR